MSTYLSTSQTQALQAASAFLRLSSAYETPADEAFIARLAQVASSTGFSTTGAFQDAMKLRPFSTLVLFIAYVGSNSAGQASSVQAPVLPKFTSP
jgi:hypothetical protein